MATVCNVEVSCKDGVMMRTDAERGIGNGKRKRTWEEGK